VIGRGIATFAVLFISTALMAVFGQPLIDQLPDGAWGLDRLRDFGSWVTSPSAVFWIAAGLSAVAVYYFARRAPVTRTTTWNVSVCLGVGIVVGAAVRLTRTDLVTEWTRDPSIWILAGGYVAPLVVAAVWWGSMIWLDRALEKKLSAETDRGRASAKQPPEAA
jgi:hypothetical protein